MLKKINVGELRLGMHLQELCGTWLDHPFWKTRFLLNDPADLAKVKGSGLAQCWIDTAKGLDVAVSPAAVEPQMTAPAAVEPPPPPEGTDPPTVSKGTTVRTGERKHVHGR